MTLYTALFRVMGLFYRAILSEMGLFHRTLFVCHSALLQESFERYRALFFAPLPCACAEAEPGLVCRVVE